jgi:hypothetical protein
MKKLVYSALALSLTAVPGMASENDWSQLDQEVAALTSSLQAGEGPHLGGWIRARWDISGDVEVTIPEFDPPFTPTTQELNGATVPDVRVVLDGQTGAYGYLVQYDFITSTLLDAAIDFPIGGAVRGTVGQFKPPVVRSALVSYKDTFFMDKTLNGFAWTTRDQGAMIAGDFDALGWWVTIMNGADGALEDLFISGRVDFDLMGEGVGNVEGAYGGQDSPAVTAGLSGFNDGFADDGSGFGFDVYATTNIYSFGGELVSYDDSGYASIFAGTGASPTGNLLTPTVGLGDSAPWSISGTYMLTPDTWEVGARFQDFDNTNDERAIEIAVSHYIQGHDLKWQFQYTNFSTDSAVIDDADIISAGIVLGF